jgi:cyanamide hydratase
MSSDDVAINGWTAVPVDAGKIFEKGPYINEPDYIDVKSIQFPTDDPIVKETQQHAKDKLLKQTYNHSMRVYYWCKSIPTSQRLNSVY